MKLKVIITGATGMVGEGVLHECLNSSHVKEVLVVNRRPCGVVHSKLQEVILDDFMHPEQISEQLSAYDTCFFCLGISSIGVDSATYYRLTYNLTVGFAEALLRHNPGMSITYVSGAGTSGLETSRLNWANVKGKTENALLAMNFAGAWMFRPGFLKPTPGLKHAHRFYKYIGWTFRPLRFLFPKRMNTLAELGQAMIYVSMNGFAKRILETGDIAAAAAALKSAE
ncbi:epimerase [Pedobacter yulinensis]|uniref:Epimerase n=1 Tax=Pedobacter yulinensis TaxID=2126353 RepID=A0A2T3HMB7_9SPHI|nr:NAD-dependent epimerase/dehydratase family protein [Pedobacter yulinensis]PST83511.1 epimerase [Pedobacter yulinensis]